MPAQLLLKDRPRISVEDIQEMIQLARKHRPDTVLFPWPQDPISILPTPQHGFDKEAFRRIVKEMMQAIRERNLIFIMAKAAPLRGHSRVRYFDDEF